MTPRSWIPLVVVAIFLASAGCSKPTPTKLTTAGGDTPAEKGRTYRWTFDDGPAGGAPSAFVSVLGQWNVQAEQSAPSKPNVLRQTGSFGDPDFPRILVEDLTFTDLTVRVRCRPESGNTDQACGLVFRLKDSDDYYVTRANALEGNVRLYRVVGGDRQQFASASLAVTSGEWHTLEASARGASLVVKWDGAEVITTTDTSFERGKIGLWTKADSVTAFDDLEATTE
jgi:hypothetical protein